MKYDMIRLKGTAVHYRVPEDMFPHAAAQMVSNGRAEWVERHDQTLLEKAKALMGAGKQRLQDRRNRAETAAMKKSTEAAALVVPPARTLVDTGAEDFEVEMQFDNVAGL